MSRKPVPDRDAALTQDSLKLTPPWLEYFKDADRRTPGVPYSTTEPTNGQVYVYNSTTGLLEPTSIGARFTNSLGADVALNNTGLFFTGPTVAQGTTGTWFVAGSVTVQDTAGAARINAVLWDGTTVIASAQTNTTGATGSAMISLAGYISSPAGNLRISCQDITSTSGKITFNQTGLSKDATISAFRVA
jgi:hypothetical protein